MRTARWVANSHMKAKRPVAMGYFFSTLLSSGLVMAWVVVK
jgi:hypothetical protein